MPNHDYRCIGKVVRSSSIVIRLIKMAGSSFAALSTVQDLAEWISPVFAGLRPTGGKSGNTFQKIFVRDGVDWLVEIDSLSSVKSNESEKWLTASANPSLPRLRRIIRTWP
jgi:hypothetical protein